MQLIKKEPNFCDDRGQITDLIEGRTVDAITILTSVKGAVRGNHYHKETTQYTYILEGSCIYHYQEESAPPKALRVTKGDLVISPPLERHALEALEDSVLLAFCHGPRAGTQYEVDTFRLDPPLCDPRRKGSR